MDKRGHQDRDPLLRRLAREREDGSPPLEPPELCARFEEDRRRPPDDDRRRPLDELAALAWPELVRLRFAPLSSLEDELLTSASSIVPRHAPDSASFIMM